MHAAAQSRRPTPGHIVPYKPARARLNASQTKEVVTQLQTDPGDAQLDLALHTPASQSWHAKDSASSDQVSSAGHSNDCGDYSSDDVAEGLNQQEASAHNALWLPTVTGSTTHPAARRQLILSADINLDELHAFQEDLTALDVYLPPNTLVLEFTDGLCLFPSLHHGSTSSDSSAIADRAAASLPVMPGTAALQDQAISHAVPDSGAISEQVCTAQLLLQQRRHQAV